MKRRILKNIFSIIVLIVMILTIMVIVRLNVIPNKYFRIIILGELVLYLFGLILYNLKNKLLMVIGILLFIISILGNCVGYYYVNKTNDYFDKSFSIDTYKVKTHYYLITGSTNPINSIDELSAEQVISYNGSSIGINSAKKALGDFNYHEIEYGGYTYYTFVNVSKNNTYFLLPSDEYLFLIGSSNALSEDMFKIIKEFDAFEEYKLKGDIPDAFNIYVNGYDYTGKQRDYNLIATVNLKTHKIVLTSIPRDYYIDIPAYGAKDSLSALGVVNSDITKEALENLFNIKIDYTATFYTESLVKVVDTIGGVEFCSDYSFTTTHDMNLGSYADKGEKLFVPKGCQTYNGVQTLAIARERAHIPNGERARQDNCRKILISILHKLASTSTITNYSETLDSFEGLYTTDINKRMIKEIIKEGIDNPNFEIIEQSVDGKDGKARNHWNTGDIYTLDPYMDTVNNASLKINEVINEK